MTPPPYTSSEAMEQYLRRVAPPIADRVMPRALPAIGMVATEALAESISIGTSKLGGMPDVPEGFDWPVVECQEYQFIAQFHLGELRRFDLNHSLPQSGLLSFFVPLDPYALEGQGKVPLVYHFPQGVTGRLELPLSQQPKARPSSLMEKLKHWAAGGDFKPAVPSCRLDFETRWQLPYLDNLEADLTKGEIDEFAEAVMESADWPEPMHQLLGYTTPIQGELEWGAALHAGKFDRKHDREKIEAESKNWTLLFQLDSQGPWMWGDAGMLYYLIHRDDLQTGRFDRVSMEIQMH